MTLFKGSSSNTNFDGMFSDDWIGVQEAADNVRKDLIIHNRWTQMLNKYLNLSHKQCTTILNKRVRPLRGRPLWGHPCSIFTMGISFFVQVKAHIPKTIRKKK